MNRQERIELPAEAIEELENLEPRIASLEARMSNMVVVVDGILRREQVGVPPPPSPAIGDRVTVSGSLVGFDRDPDGPTYTVQPEPTVASPPGPDFCKETLLRVQSNWRLFAAGIATAMKVDPKYFEQMVEGQSGDSTEAFDAGCRLIESFGVKFGVTAGLPPTGMRSAAPPPHLRGNDEPFEEGGAGPGPDKPEFRCDCGSVEYTDSPSGKFFRCDKCGTEWEREGDRLVPCYLTGEKVRDGDRVRNPETGEEFTVHFHDGRFVDAAGGRVNFAFVEFVARKPEPDPEPEPCLDENGNPIRVGDWVVRGDNFGGFGLVKLIIPFGSVPVRLCPHSWGEPLRGRRFQTHGAFLRVVPESEIRSIFAGVETVARCCGPLVRYGTKEPCFARVGDLALVSDLRWGYLRVRAIEMKDGVWCVVYGNGNWDHAADITHVVRGGDVIQ